MFRRTATGIFAGLAIVLLILDSRTALTGAQSGIELCLYSVIPAIFPFLVLSAMLTPVICGSRLPFLRPIGRLLGIPQGAEGIFLTGVLGGYPTGAQTVRHTWSRGQLRTGDARRMLAFCSNAGPSFLFGILGTKFAEAWMLWLLWGIHILSAIVVGAIMPGRSSEKQTVPSAPPISLPQALRQGVVTMGCICGWVVLFRIILAFADRWLLWPVPGDIRIGAYGILELANGCCSLQDASTDGMRFILASGILAFGGICVLMQTVTVTGCLGLGMYLPGKLLQTAVSLLLSAATQYLFFPADEIAVLNPSVIAVFAVTAVILVLFAVKMKNRGSIPSVIGV